MPKYVWHDFYLSLHRDIETNYSAGERYLTVRGIATKFGVSLQTAQRGVTQLAQEHLVSSKPRSGIIVCAKNQHSLSLQNKRVFVITALRDKRFYTSFLSGVRSSLETAGVEVDLLINDFPSETSLAFGEHLLSLGADGIIALAFPHSALPFYHAMREGQDIVSDIILNDLPSLPAVQTDNYSHSYEAGRILRSHDCEHYYMISFDPKEENKRYEGFCDGLQDRQFCNKLRERHINDYVPKTPHVSYICLRSGNAIGLVMNALLNHGKNSAFFIADWSACYLFGALCLQEGMQPQIALVYDADDAYFCLNGLEPIRAVAPPLYELGIRLGNTLLAKWQSGFFPMPLQQKI